MPAVLSLGSLTPCLIHSGHFGSRDHEPVPATICYDSRRQVESPARATSKGVSVDLGTAGTAAFTGDSGPLGSPSGALCSVADVGNAEVWSPSFQHHIRCACDPVGRVCCGESIGRRSFRLAHCRATCRAITARLALAHRLSLPTGSTPHMEHLEGLRSRQFQTSTI